jgi:predicted 3-demethylubiquinone-9 3-methyltransferase (glyoxalase superfamily)
MQKVTTFLWFDHEAGEAAQFYVSIFNNSKILDIRRYGSAGPGAAGSVMTVSFQLEGQEFIALNGGPIFKFNEAVSLFVRCETQEEVDTLWDKLCDGGQPGRCAWLKDKYGLSWQIVPIGLDQMLSDPDPATSQRVMQAMLKMNKIDIAALKAAYDGKPG